MRSWSDAASPEIDATQSGAGVFVRGREQARALCAYRGFVFAMVARDFHGRYRGSVLGASWALVNPLVQILVYTVVFAQVMSAKLPGVSDQLGYGLYLCAGLLPWSYFVDVVMRSQVVFLDHANLLKKVTFPRVTLPVYVFVSATINFAIVWGVFLAFLLLSGRWPGWVLLGMIPVLILQQVFALALGVFLGVANVFFRDVAQVVGVGLQFWFWLTPIVYSLSVVPRNVQGLIALNPLAGMIAAYQGIIVEHRWPAWSALWPVVALGLVAVLSADVMLRRQARSMVDEL
jgi:lipopolysaccharide transport system permease protein